MDNQRLFLYMAFGFISLLLYQAWLVDYGPQPEPAAVEGQVMEEGGEDLPAVATIVDDSSSTTAMTGEQAGTSSDATNIAITTDVITATLSTQGGTLTELKLPRYPVSIDEPETPFTLLSSKADDFLIAQSGLQGAQGVDAPNHREIWQAQQNEYHLAPGEDTLAIPLVWQKDGVTVTKTMTFHRNSYRVDVEYQIDNASDQPFPVSQYYQLQARESDSAGSNQFIRTYTGAVVSTEEERYQKVDFGDIRKDNLSLETKGGWVAMIQHYFASAWAPPQESTSNFYSIYLDNQARYIIGSNSRVHSVEPGTSHTLSATGYIGPKVQEWLADVAPHLELTVDFGWLTILAQPLFWILKNIHAVVGNWGWAIILLTCLIKAVFYPLSQASYKSMARMKKLQPQLQALKERYGDDRAQMGQATMELYKKEKVNPLGGCLPMIIQIPVFIALYWMLLESVELRQAPWMFWIKDLAIKDPYYVMPVIMGVTMFIQQKLNPAPVDPIQAKVFMVLPLVFTIFFAFFPAGLVLYWIVNNTLSIAQQYYITRHVIGDK